MKIVTYIKEQENRIILFTSLVISIYLILKSFLMNITIDEAYSFLSFVYVDDIFNISIANNHFLNTLLMKFSTQFSNFEFYLRLPNLLFGLIYIYLSYKISIHSKFKLFSIVFFCSFPYVLDLFIHARGYGITFVLNFIGINLYLKNSFEKLETRYIVSSLCFYLASVAINYNLIFLSSFFIIFTVKHFKELTRSKLFITSNFIFLLLSTPILRLIFISTEPGKPVYGVENLEFAYYVKYFFGYTLLLNFQYEIVTLLISSTLFFFTLKKSYGSELELKHMFYISTFQLFIIPQLFNRPLPLLRLLTPFLPLLIFWIYLAIENLDLKIANKKLISFFSLILFLNIINNLNLYSSIIWPGTKRKEFLRLIEIDSACVKLPEFGANLEYYLILYNIIC